MQHETTPNDNQTALPEPKFGEWLRGIYASESNPHRDGMYVRTIRRTGKLNPGVHYEVTDGNGKFWQYPAQSVERLATPPAVQPAGGEAVRGDDDMVELALIAWYASGRKRATTTRDWMRAALEAALGQGKANG